MIEKGENMNPMQNGFCGLGIAQTARGKTPAYGIPMIQRLAKRKSKGLVLAPTRG
jgi:superfamily II DNA/RNA helicase